MINELILPSKIHNTEQDVERDLINWVQEDANLVTIYNLAPLPQ